MKAALRKFAVEGSAPGGRLTPMETQSDALAIVAGNDATNHLLNRRLRSADSHLPGAGCDDRRESHAQLGAAGRLPG